MLDSGLLLLPQRYKFSSKSQPLYLYFLTASVVVATAKVQIFKQITTGDEELKTNDELLLLPQRYKFSSKSQPTVSSLSELRCCCCYRKGTNFQANHNILNIVIPFSMLLLLPQRYKFSSKSQPVNSLSPALISCCCYRKGTNFQANHNPALFFPVGTVVVVATAKVQIFKQITTNCQSKSATSELLLLPQRYKFSSKSQLFYNTNSSFISCCCYRKGTNFQANHNCLCEQENLPGVVVATAKVQIFKQITTETPSS